MEAQCEVVDGKALPTVWNTIKDAAKVFCAQKISIYLLFRNPPFGSSRRPSFFILKDAWSCGHIFPPMKSL